MYRKHPVLRGAEIEGLLQAEYNEQDPRHDKEGNGLSAVPSVSRSSEVDGHDNGDESSSLQHHAEVIHILEFGRQAFSWARVERRQEDEIDRCEDGAYY